MIVSERNVSDALAYLADDPHPVAQAKHALTIAENECKRIWSICFLEADGSVDARKAKAETDLNYQEAKEIEARAVLELERHRSRVKAAEMLLEIFRTENANVRAAERIR
jgi:hypothetical protein